MERGRRSPRRTCAVCPSSLDGKRSNAIYCSRVCKDRARAAKTTERRDRHLLHTYGITQSQYDALYEAQRGTCAICFGNGTRSRWGLLYVDHDHRTGVVRGLLCDRCNLGLGKFHDDPGLLRRALAYLLEG